MKEDNLSTNRGGNPLVGQYKVIVLCGSTRFKDKFMEAQKCLTLAGNIVISVGLFGHSGDNEFWKNMGGHSDKRDAGRYAQVQDRYSR